MGLRSAIRGAVTGIGGRRDDEPLPPRSERRKAARERHSLGGRAWTERDRHLDTGSRPSIADTADPGVAGAVGTVIGNILRSRRKS